MKKSTIISALMMLSVGALAQADTKIPFTPVKDTVPLKMPADTMPAGRLSSSNDSTAASSFIDKYKQDSVLNNLSANKGRLDSSQYLKKTNTTIVPANDIAVTGKSAPVTNQATATNPSWSPLDQGRVSVVGGQTYITSNNRAELITKDMTLNDGTVVMTDGTIKKSNGKTLRLKNGQGYSYGQPTEKSKTGENKKIIQ